MNLSLFFSLFSYVIPLLFLSVFSYAAVKKVKLYDCFLRGGKEALSLCFNLFPFLIAVFVLSELFDKSGTSDLLCNLLETPFSWLGVPKELIKLILIKPFSGSGATALLSEIFASNPPDSYISRCAAVCFGSSETVFYITAVYFSSVKNVKLTKAVFISLFCSLSGAVLACFLCRFI